MDDITWSGKGLTARFSGIRRRPRCAWPSLYLRETKYSSFCALSTNNRREGSDNEASIQNIKSKENPMALHLSLQPLIALIAGILILVMPKLLNLIVAIYLILIGVAGLLHLNL